MYMEMDVFWKHADTEESDGTEQYHRESWGGGG